MTSFLGVPIRFGEEAIGNFYLTEKEGARSSPSRINSSSSGSRSTRRWRYQRSAVSPRARRSGELLRAIIEHMPDAVTIRERAGRARAAANDSARDLLGHATLPPGGFADPAARFRPKRPSGQPLVVRDTPTVRALPRAKGAWMRRSSSAMRKAGRCISR